MDALSYISNADPGYIDSLYQTFKTNPTELDEGWKRFFEGFDLALSLNGSAPKSAPKAAENQADDVKVYRLIEGYRSRAHLLSTTNPIRPRRNRHPKLELADFGLDESHLSQTFQAGHELGIGAATLHDIIQKLHSLYAKDMGVEYMHIEDNETRMWFQQRYESTADQIKFPLEKEKRILEKLNEATVFEHFLHAKYVGQKRFSLEGGENTISALDAIIRKAALDYGVKEVVIGMAHRGRLNVLANVMRKTYEYIFSEFEGIYNPEQTMGDGDVKYHLGYSSAIELENDKRVYLKLMPNPSHLEAVNAVVGGFTRAKGDLLYDRQRSRILPILLHGDAAVAGQGVVYEYAQMSGLDGYRIGGTIHFVINNQIGFTTDFDDARTSTYCTAVGYLTDSPIIHVNGDDAEAVVYAVELAVDYRQKFGKDIYIDMVCYRKYGHNEGDEPKFTQPTLYNLISAHSNPREIYLQTLVQRGDLMPAEAAELEKEFKDLLNERLQMVRQQTVPYTMQPTEKQWAKLRRANPEDFHQSPDTSAPQELLDAAAHALTVIPENFPVIKQVIKEVGSRKERYAKGEVNWALAELLAYGTLVQQGVHVRMSGQDVVRGTFSHRHSTFWNEKTGEEYTGLSNISENQSRFEIYNSLLSEYAVLAFEYGYSMADPHTLTIWEAQFGDFANGAQVAIDQYIAAGESKWGRMNGVCLFLPHGYEGQGPEHSSGRLERFLDLSAEYNMVVANCTTPANFFHLLRRQMAWEFRKPLIHFSPKSLLRNAEVVSQVSELANGRFREIIPDDYANKKSVKRILFCSGKIYYDLLARQKKEKRKDVAIVRVEQLFPMPEQQIDAIRAQYKGAKCFWVQEEPKNMGAWTYWLRRAEHYDFELISRKASASPATGYQKAHVIEQERLVAAAFDTQEN